MDMTSAAPQYLIPFLVVITAVAILSWGYWRSKRLGKLGLLSWLQLVVLMGPWFVYFGLFLLGIFVNFALLLLLLLISTVGYIFVGAKLRQAALSEREKLKQMMPSERQTSDNAQDGDRPTDETTTENGNNEAEQARLSAEISAALRRLNQKPSMPKEDIKAIQGIFGVDTFYATETLPYQEGVIFKGNLRGEPSEAHASLNAALQKRFPNKYDLFLVEGQEKRPVVVILPCVDIDAINPTQQKILAGLLVIGSFATCLALGNQLQEIDIMQSNQLIMLNALPFAIGLAVILAVRELAQRWVASKYNVQISVPFFLPSLQLGCFGGFSRILSPLPDRKALFDIAVAPAIASGLISLLMFVGGLLLSANGMGNVEVPTQVFQSSLLAGILGKLTLGNALHNQFVAIHPLVVLGWIGLVITALNLMPAGQLDGGRIVQAIYGRRTAGITTVLTLICLAIATFVNPLALYWGGIILILLRDLERPMLNEISELDGDRDALGIFALFWMIATIMPMTRIVAARLGIGS
jgi:membrane-associated protease RseP (regulator of RpoE activity)